MSGALQPIQLETNFYCINKETGKWEKASTLVSVRTRLLGGRTSKTLQDVSSRVADVMKSFKDGPLSALDYTTNKDELQSHQQNITLLEGKVMNRLENKWWFYLAQFLGVIFGSLVSQTKQETALRFARAHQEIEAALQQLEDKNSVR